MMALYVTAALAVLAVWLLLSVLAAVAFGRAVQLRDRSVRLDEHGRLR